MKISLCVADGTKTGAPESTENSGLWQEDQVSSLFVN